MLLVTHTLLDVQFYPASVGPHAQARVDQVLARAQLEGANYHPGCNKLVGIILVPTNPTTDSHTQNTIILVPRYHFHECVVPDSDEGK